MFLSFFLSFFHSLINLANIDSICHFHFLFLFQHKEMKNDENENDEKWIWYDGWIITGNTRAIQLLFLFATLFHLFLILFSTFALCHIIKVFSFSICNTHMWQEKKKEKWMKVKDSPEIKIIDISISNPNIYTLCVCLSITSLFFLFFVLHFSFFFHPNIVEIDIGFSLFLILQKKKSYSCNESTRVSL